MTFKRLLFVLLFIVPGCTAPTAPASRPSALLRNVQQINGDGATKLVESDLTPFQQLVRYRLTPRPSADAPRAPEVDDLITLEIGVPDGQGNEGAFLAVLHSASSTEFRYFEQIGGQPRADRYFHRTLSTAESAEIFGFLKAHPLPQLLKETTAHAKPAATQPATQPQEEAAAQLSVHYRLTRARLKGKGDEAQTLVLDSPSENDHPAIDLLNMLARFRDVSALTCSYYQPIPLTARILYADPYRQVMRVWSQGDDLRVAVSSPIRPLETTPPSEEEHWLAFKDNQWAPCEPPPAESATQPAEVASAPTAPAMAAPVPQNVRGVAAALPSGTQAVVPAQAVPPAQVAVPTTLPVAGTQAAVPATLPSRFSNPDVLPTAEMWTATPRETFTAVGHYLPLSAQHGVWKEFWVPAFQFDAEHMSVDVRGGMLYLIHGGQLFALPIPAGALSPG